MSVVGLAAVYAALALAQSQPTSGQHYGSSPDRRTDYDRRIQDLEDQQAARDKAAKSRPAPASSYNAETEAERARGMANFNANNRAAIEYMNRQPSAPTAPAVPRWASAEVAAALVRDQQDLQTASEWLNAY